MTLVLPETLTVERPAEVIDLRRAQVEFWSRNDALPLAIAANGVRPMPGHTVAEGAAAHVIWMRNTLQNAERAARLESELRSYQLSLKLAEHGINPDE